MAPKYILGYDATPGSRAALRFARGLARSESAALVAVGATRRGAVVAALTAPLAQPVA